MWSHHMFQLPYNARRPHSAIYMSPTKLTVIWAAYFPQQQILFSFFLKKYGSLSKFHALTVFYFPPPLPLARKPFYSCTSPSPFNTATANQSDNKQLFEHEYRRDKYPLSKEVIPMYRGQQIVDYHNNSIVIYDDDDG